MKVAFVHDHLTQSGGAERVLQALQAMWPHAPTYTLAYDRRRMGDMFWHRDIRTSFLQRFPLSKMRWLLPLMPTATESYDLSGYDVVISSSSAFAKGVVTSNDALHICYCHTPTRYLWSDTHSYSQELRAPRWAKSLLPPLLTLLRQWDHAAAHRVDHFIANSRAVARRITKYYRRESTVIYPPIDVDHFRISTEPKTYFLAGGRLVAYKRFDLIVEAFNRIGLPLKIFGTGPAETELRKMAGPNIEFLGRVSDEARAHLFTHAIAFINPQEEDFGITPLESMASGRPVIAFGRGGALETVIDGVTGKLFYEQTWEELADTVLHFVHTDYDPQTIRAHAEKFSTAVFRKAMYDFVEQRYQEHQQRISGNVQ